MLERSNGLDTLRNLLEQDTGLPELLVDVDRLTPLKEFREWIEKPENLNLWMRYPAGIDEDEQLAMRIQISQVLDRPDEVSPKVIFNVALVFDNRKVTAC